MKKESLKIVAICIMLSLLAAAVSVYPFAKTDVIAFEVSPDYAIEGIGGNDDSVKVQNKSLPTDLYKYSWLRNLIVKEDIRTPEGIDKRSVLVPVAAYPYTYTAATFKKEVNSYVALYSQNTAYLAAHLDLQYNITIDQSELETMLNKSKVPFYVLQCMGKQDKGLSISEANYTYEKAFDLVAQKTNRFDLEDDFYADIYEYDIKLEYKRNEVYFRPIPLYPNDRSKGISVRVFLDDGTELANDYYSAVSLSGKSKEAVTLFVRYYSKDNSGKDVNISTTAYKLNFIQGTATPPGSSVSTTYDYPSSTVSNPDISSSDIMPPNGTISQLESEILGQLYTTDIHGNYVAADGNTVTSLNNDDLPDGYEYTIYRDGSVGVVPVMGTASSSETEDGSVILSGEFDPFSKTSSLTDNWETIIIVLVCIVLIVLIIALIIVVRLRKKKQEQLYMDDDMENYMQEDIEDDAKEMKDDMKDDMEDI